MKFDKFLSFTRISASSLSYSTVSNTKSNGWQSQRFCSYPQELILQFDSLVHLTQLQILFHEKKIPYLVELYIWNPRNETLTTTVQYQRLGHFTLSDNSKNNYKSRELKSVTLDHWWKYLKILFGKPFFNKYNPFNQVGVVRIVCHGDVMKEEESKFNSSNLAQIQAVSTPVHLSGQGQQDQGET